MLNFKSFKQIFLVLTVSSIIIFQIKPMEEITPQKLDIGICSQQGPRPSMEDKYQIIKNWGNTGITYAAVFDGHGGKCVATYLSNNLHVKIFEKFQTTKNLKEAIQQGCAQINQEILETQQNKRNTTTTGRICRNISFCETGSCAIIAFIFDNKVIIANVGDSRAVISKNKKAIQLSVDHKPNEASEQERIEASGGKVWISDNGKISRLCFAMGLAVARAFGNLAYKDLIIANPQIVEYDFLGDDILILACDGLWDVMQNQEATNFASKYSKMQEASEALVKEAIETRHTNDNVTIITIKPSDPHLWVDYTRKP